MLTAFSLIILLQFDNVLIYQLIWSNFGLILVILITMSSYTRNLATMMYNRILEPTMSPQEVVNYVQEQGGLDWLLKQPSHPLIR